MPMLSPRGHYSKFLFVLRLSASLSRLLFGFIGGLSFFACLFYLALSVASLLSFCYFSSNKRYFIKNLTGYSGNLYFISCRRGGSGSSWTSGFGRLYFILLLHIHRSHFTADPRWYFLIAEIFRVWFCNGTTYGNNGLLLRLYFLGARTNYVISLM